MSTLEPNINKIAYRAGKTLSNITDFVTSQKKEFGVDKYVANFSKAALHSMPHLSKAIVDKTVQEMEEMGYKFNRIQAGSTYKYALSQEDVAAIYRHRHVPTYRDRYQDKGAMVLFIINLKGGVAKTVSTVNLAHGLRTHESLIKEDLRILVVDLDPQASATMFLAPEYSLGSLDNSSAQGMLQNLTREELLEEFIVESSVKGVDVMPASIEDGFIASKWKELCDEYLPETNYNLVLKKNILDKLKHDYDFILVDTGPHLDAFLQNGLSSADVLLIPLPPAQVDFHSSLKFINRLPELIHNINESGCEVECPPLLGFMTKMSDKKDHLDCLSMAKEVFGGDMLDERLPRLDGFERCGESFDTTISAKIANYAGSSDALKKAKKATLSFSKAMFDRLEFMRSV